MRASRFVLLLPVVLAFAGCTTGRSASKPQLTTHADSYDPGEDVSVRLENDTAASIGYNLCFAFLTLERRTDTGWEPVDADLGPDTASACTLEIRGLAPDESASGVAHLPDDLASGTYRLKTDVEIESVREPVASEPFEVHV